ncbi:MAG TPA: hypothetical protein VI248_10180 [Kineosporiaceae bacterium]
MVGTVRRVLGAAGKTLGLVLSAAALCGIVVLHGAIMSTLWSVHPLLSIAAALPLTAVLTWFALKLCTAGGRRRSGRPPSSDRSPSAPRLSHQVHHAR